MSSIDLQIFILNVIYARVKYPFPKYKPQIPSQYDMFQQS